MKLFVAVVLLALALVWGMGSVAAQEDPGDWLLDEFPPDAALPDLQTLPIVDLTLQVVPDSGDRLLRFSNSIINAGRGPLELRGKLDRTLNAVVVAQHIYGTEEVLIEPVQGTFYFSGDHLHWHWEDFVAYEVWTVETGGDLSRRVVVNDKVGFCLYDSHPVSNDWIAQNVPGWLERPSAPVYTTCRFGRQGISMGWADIYRRHLPGQMLDISDLEDGIYALRSVVNPAGLLYELNLDNNDTVLYFALHEDELMVLGEEYSLMDYFEQLVDAEHIEIVDGKVAEESLDNALQVIRYLHSPH